MNKTQKQSSIELAKSILALSLMCTKQEAEAVPLAKSLLQSGKDENAKQFAQQVLSMQKDKVLPFQDLQKEQLASVVQ